jgi:hypothetical protein
MKPLAKWLTKIDEDFTGALPHWQEHLRAVSFGDGQLIRIGEG